MNTYTAREIADICNVTRQTVYRYIRLNKIKPVETSKQGVSKYSKETTDSIVKHFAKGQDTVTTALTEAQLENRVLHQHVNELTQLLKEMNSSRDKERASAAQERQELISSREELIKKTVELQSQHEKDLETIEQLKNKGFWARLFNR